MEYVRLGATGLKVSRLCLGCMTYGSSKWRPWVMDEAEARPFFRQAIEAGINFFDTADMYSLGQSEVVTGNVLKDLAPRDQLVIATKVYNPMGKGPNDRGLSRKHIMQAIDASLKRLGTDYVDLYQIHRFDYETPMEETIDALNEVVRAGKALYIGASSMHAWQFMKMLGLQRKGSLARFVSMQPHYNLLYREEEREMFPLCQSEGIGVIPWSPLARGRLTRPFGETTVRSETDVIGKALYKAEDAADHAVVDALAALAAARGEAMASLALAWHFTKPAVAAPIIGATKPAHIADAVRALDLALPAEEIAALEAPYRPKWPTGMGMPMPAMDQVSLIA